MQVEDAKPWYRQFWPWFLILLPGSVVVAGFATLFIAINSADSLVDDDYYKEGMAINQSLAQDETAEALSLSADIRWDRVTGELLVTMHGDLANPEFLQDQQLELLLFHPTDHRLDKTLVLNQLSHGYFRGSVNEALRYRYYLRLRPTPAENWRLSGELNFTGEDTVTLDSR